MLGVEFALFKDLSASLQPSQRPRQRCTWEAAQEQVVRADDNINLLEGAGRARQTQTADEEIHFVDRQASKRAATQRKSSERTNQCNSEWKKRRRQLLGNRRTKEMEKTSVGAVRAETTLSKRREKEG